MFRSSRAGLPAIVLAVFMLLVAACGESGPTFTFETLPPGSDLPDDATCAEQVRADSSEENRPENTTANNTVVDIDVTIDGALELNDELAPRVTGDFTGTTEQVLRWAAHPHHASTTSAAPTPRCPRSSRSAHWVFGPADDRYRYPFRTHRSRPP